MKLNRLFIAVVAICISLCTQTTQAQLPVLCYPGGDGNGSTGCATQTIDLISYIYNSVNKTNDCAPGGCGSSSYSLSFSPRYYTTSKVTPLFQSDAITYTLQRYDFANVNPNTWIDVATNTYSYTSWTAPISGAANMTPTAFTYSITASDQYAMYVQVKKAGVVVYDYRFCLGTFVVNQTTSTLNSLTKINGTVATTTPVKICYTGSGTAISLSVPYLGVAPVCTVQVWQTNSTYTANTALISSLSATYSNYGSPGTYNLNPPYAYTDGYYKVVISGTNHCGTSFGPIVAKYQLISPPTGNFTVGYVSGGSSWIPHGTAGNTLCSPINTCYSQLAIGGATGTGSLSGVRFKLEKQTGGTCSTPTWATVFDGSGLATWNYGGTISSWPTLYAPIFTYANDNGFLMPFFSDYISAVSGAKFKLTAYIYNTTCTSTPLIQVAYISRNVSTCKTDGSEVATGIENAAELSSDITAYPNPATNSFTISFNNMDYNGASIKIYDVAGKLLEQRENLQNADNVFNVNAYNNGIFIYQVKLANGNVISSKFVKE